MVDWTTGEGPASPLSIAILVSLVCYSSFQMMSLLQLFKTTHWVSMLFASVILAVPLGSAAALRPKDVGEVRAYCAMFMIAANVWRPYINERLLGINRVWDTEGALGITSAFLWSYHFGAMQILTDITSDLFAGMDIAFYIISATPDDYLTAVSWAVFNLGPQPVRPEATAALFLLASLGTVLGLVGWSWSRGAKHGAIQDVLEPVLVEWWTVPLFAVYNALTEEIDFRLLLQAALLNTAVASSLLPREAATRATSLLFALMHFKGGFPSGFSGLLLVFIWSQWALVGVVLGPGGGIGAALLLHVIADWTIAHLIRSAGSRDAETASRSRRTPKGKQ